MCVKVTTDTKVIVFGLGIGRVNKLCIENYDPLLRDPKLSIEIWDYQVQLNCFVQRTLFAMKNVCMGDGIKCTKCLYLSFHPKPQ